MDRSKRPRPTTTKPMTAPEENATRSPLLRLWDAALAVRALANVAIVIPIKPDSPEKNPPVRKAKGDEGRQESEDTQEAQHHEHDRKENGDGGVLAFEVGPGAFAHGLREECHPAGSFREAYDLSPKKEGK